MSQAIAGRYELLRLLGKGAMGVVYLAEDNRLMRKVALKVMTSAGEMDEQMRQRFELEARRAAAIHHANVVTIFDAGDDNGRPYIVMELIEGQDLKELLGSTQPPPMVELLRIFVQVCDGLAHAHQSGLVHRDLKPGNIRVARTGQAKILDFGVARVIGGEATKHLTATGAVLGTPQYMSPEGFLGKPVDHRADIFSLGIILYELLTLRRPFEADSVGAVMWQIVHEQPDLTREPLTQLPPQLVEALRGALAKDPGARFQDVASLARLVSAALQSLQSRWDELRGQFRAELAAGRIEAANTILAELSVARPSQAELEQLFDELTAARTRAGRAALTERVSAALQLAAEVFDRAEGQLAALQKDHPDESIVEEGLSELTRRRAERRRAEQARARQIGEQAERLLKEATRLDQEGQEDGALARIAELLRLEPEQTAARALEERILQRRRERSQRLERISALVSQGRAAEQAGDLTRAGALARKILELEQAHPEAEQMLQRIDAEHQERVVLEQMASELAGQAERLAKAGDLQAAIETLERADLALAGLAAVSEPLRRYQSQARIERASASGESRSQPSWSEPARRNKRRTTPRPSNWPGAF
jgi:serine/threonine-protein kinase